MNEVIEKAASAIDRTRLFLFPDCMAVEQVKPFGTRLEWFRIQDKDMPGRIVFLEQHGFFQHGKYLVEAG
jgi:hypothetical protein